MNKKSKKAEVQTGTPRQIVSSAHLAASGPEGLSEFEYGLILAHNAFSRWVQRCMTAAGEGELGALDILVLHSVHHRDREKQVADICFVLAIEDAHWVTYSLKKLARFELVEKQRRGKETFWSVTAKGRDACQNYAQVRHDCLLQTLDALNLDENSLKDAADQLRALSGLYDQAARAAASL